MIMLVFTRLWRLTWDINILTQLVQSKGSLVGHSDSNAAEDVGHLRVTYANNHFYNVRSRGPLLRFGTCHVYK